MKKQWLLALLCISSIGFGTRNEDLFQAVKTDQISEIESLLRAGADVNARDKAGMTPLMHATIRAYQGMVRILVKNGADIDAESAPGLTALEQAQAAFDNQSYMVKLLRHLGANG